jgi:hypothetical protein
MKTKTAVSTGVASEDNKDPFHPSKKYLVKTGAFGRKSFVVHAASPYPSRSIGSRIGTYSRCSQYESYRITSGKEANVNGRPCSKCFGGKYAKELANYIPPPPPIPSFVSTIVMQQEDLVPSLEAYKKKIKGLSETVGALRDIATKLIWNSYTYPEQAIESLDLSKIEKDIFLRYLCKQNDELSSSEDTSTFN